MHRILKRQIKRSFGERVVMPPKWAALIKSISDTYTHFDEDRALLNRSFDLSSKEFLEKSRHLEKIRIKVEKQAQNLAFQVARRTKDLNKRITELEDARKAMTNLLEDFEEKQNALAQAKVKDEALLASIGEGVVATDQDGKVIIINRIAENLLGFAQEELMEKFFIQTVSLEDATGNQITAMQRPIILALTSKTTTTTTTTTCYFVRKDKTKFPTAITATPVLLNAKIIGAIIVFRDITKEKEIEKLRIDFLSLASHQLRTPLSGTKWLIETIQRGVTGELNSKQKDYLNNIYQINERMIKLVSDMLNVLMLEGGVSVIKKQKVSVPKLFAELFLMMESVLRSKKIALRNAFKNKKEFFVLADFQVLRSILECFVSNAINYSPNGGEVVLDAEENSAAAVFSVKDSGIGIPRAEQKRMFERFYRASNAKNLKPDGTGLGLYIASMLAKKIAGEIFFESTEGKGSVFYLRVPKH